LEESSPQSYRFVDTTLSRVPSIGQSLSKAVAELEPVSDTPRLEAEVLLAHVLDIPRTSVIAYPERVLAEGQLVRYRQLVEERATDYPLPYLLGRSEFFGLSLEVTPEVLIPRPETESLVELALAREPASVVDVGTGSGCIAIVLAAQLSQVELTAIDISPAALSVARRNAEAHEVDDRIRFVVGDVLTPRPHPVDLIVSNPPYISSTACASLQASIRDHEPRLALDGGANGLTIIQRLLDQAPAVLKSGGALLIEIGADQSEPASHLAQIAFPEAAVRVHPDLAGRDRVLEIQT